jgi:Rieske 2Fe-2S family protein
MSDATETAPKAAATDAEWQGLRQAEVGLASESYYTPEAYEHDLARIWNRQWVYLCRAESIPAALDYRTFSVGQQPVLLVRDEGGELRAFNNTCRHRGSVLCLDAAGHLPAKSITCPYHGWTYSLQGRLLRLPSHGRPASISVGDYPLYSLPTRIWNGFVFVRPTPGDPPPFDAAFMPGTATLAHWPVESLRVGHTFTTRLRCNWKIFWENFNECLHCPNVHRGLSTLVPIYRRAIMEERDDPRWRDYAGSQDPAYRGGLKAGAVTWSVDGTACGPQFPELTDDERRLGYHFVTMLPSFYVVAHVDYVRSVRMTPIGPEETELEAQWLFPPALLADPGFDHRNTTDFARQVMAEDAAVCEINQRGLRAKAHASGVLMAEEYEVHQFQNWVRRQLARAD